MVFTKNGKDDLVKLTDSLLESYE